MSSANITPEAEAFWQQSLAVIDHPPAEDFYRVRHYGNSQTIATMLGQLIVDGVKTGTFLVPRAHEGDPHMKPVVGGYTVLTDFEGKPLALLETLSVRTVKFDDIVEPDVQCEGPNLRNIAAWRNVHWEYFAAQLKPLGHEMSGEEKVTIENFRVVRKA
jgi:uncharacterized protein YhfF